MTFERIKNPNLYNKHFTTITDCGYLSFSSAIVKEFNIYEYDYLNIYYNTETKQIGLHLIKEQDSNSYKLINSNYNQRVNINYLLQEYKIKDKGRFKTYQLDDMIIIDLNQQLRKD